MKRPLSIIGVGLALGWAGSLAAAEPWTLERAVRFASTNSPDARLAAQRILAARAGLDQANAGVWPRLQFQSSYTRTDNPMLVFGSILNQRAYPGPALDFNDVPDMDDLNVRGVLSVPLYTGGRTKASRDAAKAGLEASRQEAAAVRNTLGFEVARAFHTVQKARQFIRAAEASVASYEKNLAVAKSRFDAGTLLKADLLDLEVRLAQAREELVRARNAESLATRALRSLLGLEALDFSVADVSPTVSAPDSGDFSGRPELAAARQRQRAADAEVRSARSGYQPRVSAFGGLDYDYGWRTDGDGGSYTAGLMVQWDVWDGKLTRARVTEAVANAASAHEAERKVRLALDLETEQARLALKEAGERLAVNRQSVAQAEESLELTRKRFEQGVVLATQLFDAETALLGVRVRRAEAECDERIAIAALRKALGLPQIETNSQSAAK